MMPNVPMVKINDIKRTGLPEENSQMYSKKKKDLKPTKNRPKSYTMRYENEGENMQSSMPLDYTFLQSGVLVI